jgi:F0F1-type ATP synthase assembly protein I
MEDETPRSKDANERREQPEPDPLERLRGARASDGGVGKYAGFGVQFAIAVLLFLYAGNWVDQKLGTSPLFLILGVFVGAGASFYSIYQRLMTDSREEAQRAAERKRERR